MACTVEWSEAGSTVRVVVTGVVDSGSARRVSGAIASHVGIEGVDTIEVDTSDAHVVDTRVFEELSRRFTGAGQRLVVTDEALGGGREAAPMMLRCT